MWIKYRPDRMWKIAEYHEKTHKPVCLVHKTLCTDLLSIMTG